MCIYIYFVCRKIVVPFQKLSFFRLDRHVFTWLPLGVCECAHMLKWGGGGGCFVKCFRFRKRFRGVVYL